MDNKFWLAGDPDGAACNGYEQVLDPPVCRPDIAYHLNCLLESRQTSNISHASSNNVNATVGSSSIREAVSPLEDCKLEITDLVAPSIAMSIRAPISVNSEGSCRK